MLSGKKKPRDSSFGFDKFILNSPINPVLYYEFINKVMNSDRMSLFDYITYFQQVPMFGFFR